MRKTLGNAKAAKNTTWEASDFTQEKRKRKRKGDYYGKAIQNMQSDGAVCVFAIY